MVNKSILIISPQYPSATNGLGDYSSIIGEYFKKEFKVIYVGFKQPEPVEVAPYICIRSFSSLQEILSHHQIDIIFLNYVNFAYHPKGLPFKLLRELQLIKSKGYKLCIFFHELNASSHKPWQLVFWTKPLQQYIYKHLLNIADLAFCSNERVRKILAKHQHPNLYKKAVFANIPESVEPIVFEQRSRSAIVFGTLNRRKKVYENAKELNAFIASRNIKEIVDIGPGDVKSVIGYIRCPKRILGKLSASEIAAEFAKHTWALIDYPPSLMEKSGIFAAYAAYGLITYNTDSSDKIVQDLVDGKHYLSENSLDSPLCDDKTISKNIQLWYEEHNQINHSLFIQKKIEQILANA
ncbi:hypothetical protein [Pedobacter puniceum]|uniref:Glycosyltransferase n=1 Tax=Pedobacter puniceum TaxID=2666136 RepID=A0A7K0FIB4_9SPHI|nr:hypothetical protein [Pedobacter puniceum]MRX45673.1 hypothetical protein [Pedobacter puniceum]